MTVESARSLLGMAAMFAFVAAGFLLIIGGGSESVRVLSGRVFLAGVVLAMVAGFVTPSWLP